MERADPERFAQTSQGDQLSGSGNSVPSPFGGSPAASNPHCEWAPWKANERGLPSHLIASFPDLSRGELLTRGFGFGPKNSADHLQKGQVQQNQGHGYPQTGRLSPIPTISCCKITGGDEFLFITTPAVSDTMSAQNAVSIGSRALQDSGPMHPSSTAHKELCFKAAGRIITKAMRVAPEKAGGIAAHVIFFKTQEPEAIVPRTSKHQCILKQRQEKCESCLDPREELSPRPHNSAKSCMLCKLKLNHEDWQFLNIPHEPGRSSSS